MATQIKIRISNIEAVKEVILEEQFQRNIAPILRNKIKENEHQNIEEMAKAADGFDAANDFKRYEDKPINTNIQRSNLPIKCYTCGVQGYLAKYCTKSVINVAILPKTKVPDRYIFNGKINNHYVKMFRDTGASTTVIHPQYLRDSDITSETVNVYMANGKMDEAPIAKIELEIEGVPVNTRAVVMKSKHGILLGNEIDHICEMITRSKSMKAIEEEKYNKLEEKLNRPKLVPIEGVSPSALEEYPQILRLLQIFQSNIYQKTKTNFLK